MATDRAPALIEGLRMLEILSAATDPVSFDRLTGGSIMSRSSAKRVLKVLVNSGYVSQGRTRRSGYLPGIRLSTMTATASRTTADAFKIIHGALEATADSLSASIQYAVYDPLGVRITVMDHCDHVGSIKVAGAGEDMTPMCHRHALGKTVLAFCEATERKRLIDRCRPEKRTRFTLMPGPTLDRQLAEIRNQGFAVEVQETISGVCRIGMPVLDEKKQPICAVAAAWLDLEPEKKRINAVRTELEKVAHLGSTLTGRNTQ